MSDCRLRKYERRAGDDAPSRVVEPARCSRLTTICPICPISHRPFISITSCLTTLPSLAGPRATPANLSRRLSSRCESFPELAARRRPATADRSRRASPGHSASLDQRSASKRAAPADKKDDATSKKAKAEDEPKTDGEPAAAEEDTKDAAGAEADAPVKDDAEPAAAAEETEAAEKPASKSSKKLELGDILPAITLKSISSSLVASFPRADKPTSRPPSTLH